MGVIYQLPRACVLCSSKKPAGYLGRGCSMLKHLLEAESPLYENARKAFEFAMSLPEPSTHLPGVSS